MKRKHVDILTARRIRDRRYRPSSARAHPAFARAALPRVVDQDLPHHPRGDPKEMAAVLPDPPSVFDQPQVCLIHERRGLKGVIVPLAPHVRARDTTQFSLNGGQKALLVLGISPLPELGGQIVC